MIEFRNQAAIDVTPRAPAVVEPAAVETDAGGIDIGSLHCIHVVLSLECGGLERMVLNMVRAACASGAPSTVLCLERRGPLADEAEAAGATVVCLDKPPGLTIGLPRRVRVVLAEGRFDIVHTHQMGALFYAGRVARELGIPVVHTEHGVHGYSRLKTKYMARWAVRSCRRFTCVSREIATSIAEQKIVPLEAIQVVPNGVDIPVPLSAAERLAVRASMGVGPNDFLIGTMGRLAEIKRQDLLITAFAKVYREQPHSRLLLVGDGPLRDELKSFVEQLGVKDRVHFAGYQRNPAPFLQAMDLFALTSRSEGMPLAVLEAWGAELPVVASNVGGVPELVDDGACGLMFPSGDRDALVAAIDRLIRDRQLATTLAAAGRVRLVREYSTSRIADLYQSIYRSYLQPSSTTSAAPIPRKRGSDS